MFVFDEYSLFRMFNDFVIILLYLYIDKSCKKKEIIFIAHVYGELFYTMQFSTNAKLMDKLTMKQLI
jgi:hypothetical protein